MALIDEEKLQGNVRAILDLLRRQAACCEQVATAVWGVSSIAGPVFITISKGGGVKVYTQPGGTLVTDYGVLTQS